MILTPHMLRRRLQLSLLLERARQEAALPGHRGGINTASLRRAWVGAWIAEYKSLGGLLDVKAYEERAA